MKRTDRWKPLELDRRPLRWFTSERPEYKLNIDGAHRADELVRLYGIGPCCQPVGKASSSAGLLEYAQRRSQNAPKTLLKPS